MDEKGGAEMAEIEARRRNPTTMKKRESESLDNKRGLVGPEKFSGKTH